MAKLRSTADRDADLRRAASALPGADGQSDDFRVSVPPPSSGSVPLAEALARGAPRGSDPTEAVAPMASPGSVRRMVPIDRLRDSPYQPRDVYPESELQDLARTLAAVGQQETIRVRELANGDLELIEGHRRKRAGKLLGWSELDAIVETKSDREAQIAVFTSFDTHQALSEWARAKMYQRTLDDGLATTQAGVADIFGCTPGRVSQVLGTFKLPAPVLAVFEQYSALVTSRIVAVASQLNTAHPTEGQLIADAIIRVFADGAPVESIKSWTEGQLARRNRVGKTPSRSPSVVLNGAGRPVFNVKVTSKGEVTVVPSKEFDVPAETLQKWIVASLRERADKVSEDGKEK
ncbi:ParB/RepB/Spo0J family partition protein [Burkholderia cepacia]|uniref:ParB/RepB/Spo0J family partition protein n=1 Tax=Burkholderia cepacia TaxID=292 RepID=UPI002AB69835|nr:ParB/RepB/Spo0J family partition protein [Burkholderia cepacia]